MSLTIFSAPKPFTDPHITVIQRNAIRSWANLGHRVEVLLVGDDHGIGSAATQLGVAHLPDVARNAHQTPLISSIFELARSKAQHERMAYVNADIILMDDFLSSIDKISMQQSEFLVVGQRWDLDQEAEIEFQPGWDAVVRKRLESEGTLHPPAGSDYFVFPRDQFENLPPFALGRPGWDNWMIFKGRSMGLPVIDASAAITVVHQTHDYSHIEGGIPHYQTEERQVNVQLGGGSDTVFTLADATWRLNGGGLSKIPWHQAGLIHGVKSGLVARFSTPTGLRVLHVLLHPLNFTRNFFAMALRGIIGAEG